MKLTGFHLLLTYRCTYECDHCFVYSSPNAEATMTLELAKRAISQAKEVGTVEEIYFEGGEPFLYFPLMLAAAKHAKELGLSVGIVTNSYWATTVEDAVEWFRPLKDIGVDYVSISDDIFHNPDQDIDSFAANARKAAKEVGIDTGVICIDPPSEIPSNQKKGEPILGGGVRFRGRAVEKLATDNLPRKSWDTFTECPDEDWIDIGRLHLDPFGYLYPCQGIVLGNLNENSLQDIVDKYNPDTHPVISPLKNGGPAEIVKKYDLPLKSNYLDACHLCYLARKELRKQDRFREFIAPGQVYRE